ncbi:MAG: lysophospholipid acyltransferase family protein [Bacteroidetes bacterium]|nr:lysophospholipid acyltransferase family protein [Bacteroidota bacterium]MDA1336866.1 lysophospholipid acyltransferase family protein [Bacteroidota bacterium]
MLRLLGNNNLNVTFHSPEADPSNWPVAAVFVSNHMSQLDINASAASIPRPIVYLAKESIRKVPLLGLLNERVGTVFIDRSNPQSAKQSIERLHRTINDGISVIVYPEGTRSSKGDLLPFKKGAFHLAQATQTQVIPIHIHGTQFALPKGSFFVRRNPIHVRFGAPIDPPKTASKTDIDAFKNQAEQAILKMKEWHESHLDTPN